MKWNITHLQTRLYLIAAIILLVGLGSATLIYLAAENAADSVLGYEPENSKMYIHDLELYGGKANVLANELMHWFVGLWHGKSLAFTVGCITLFISFVVFFVANHMPSDVKSDDRDENNRAGTG
ncbi:MAG: hypothetical protein M1508_02460 [Nitrospirae bacterium]|nr:hypothetical protein [Nitrospirota bacterium]MCL5421642.1 hypothetical protein [Nitrospirota bacterium]